MNVGGRATTEGAGSNEANELDFSTFSASRTQRVFASGAAFVVIAAAAAMIPVGSRPVGPVAPFLPAVLSFVILCDAITAYLLWCQCSAGGRTSLALLGFAYALNGLLPIPYFLTFPGIFGDAELLGGPQSGITAWTVWHGCFPILVLAYLFVRNNEQGRGSRRAVNLFIALLTFAALGMTAVVTYAIVAAPDRLPILIEGRTYTATFEWLGRLEAILAALALWALVVQTRLRTVAHLWLAIAVLAFVADITITLLATRFSIAWYAARLQSLVAAGAVLFALLGEAGRLTEHFAASQRRLSAIVEGVADALMTLDDERRIVSWNAAAQELFGATGGFAGKTIDDLVPDFSAIDPNLGERDRLASGKRTDGGTITLEISRTVLPARRQDGGTTILIARDVTQRERAQLQLETARDHAVSGAQEKAQFLATMSHEIRTPLNAVIGMSELLLNTELTSDQRDYASTTQLSAEALLSIINDILDFSKIEAGKIELESLPFAALAVVESAASIVSAQAYQKKIALQTYVAPEVPRTVWGDADRLRQVLLNLLSNAVKFTENGTVLLRVDLVGREAHVARLRFAVADTGIGISTEALSRLFAPFAQAEGHTSRRYGGTGLGLSISKKLVELMGGSISVASEPNVGSTFSFTIGLTLGRETPTESPAERGLDGTRILVVDDDPASRAILSQYAAAWGASVSAAADGAQAFDMLGAATKAGTPFDVALLDYAMPGEHGYDLGRRIRNEPAFAAMRLILITAYDDVGRGVAAVEAGFSAYLRKPVRQSLLHTALTSATPMTTAPSSLRLPVSAIRNVSSMLLVDDNAINVKIALKQLEALGIHADAVGSGDEAIAATAAHHYALVFMDCQMPGTDGFEATRQIRIRESTTGLCVPIVAMTANAMEGDREACLASGMDDYIAKPIRVDTLREVIERRLGPNALAPTAPR